MPFTAVYGRLFAVNAAVSDSIMAIHNNYSSSKHGNAKVMGSTHRELIKMHTI